MPHLKFGTTYLLSLTILTAFVYTFINMPLDSKKDTAVGLANNKTRLEDLPNEGNIAANDQNLLTERPQEVFTEVTPENRIEVPFVF